MIDIIVYTIGTFISFIVGGIIVYSEVTKKNEALKTELLNKDRKLAEAEDVLFNKQGFHRNCEFHICGKVFELVEKKENENE